MKVCVCCSTLVTNDRKRVCKRCKAPAIWRAATPEEVAREKAAAERLLETYKSLMGDINDSAL